MRVITKTQGVIDRESRSRWPIFYSHATYILQVAVHGNYILWTSKAGLSYGLVDVTATELGVVYLSVIRESGEALPLYGLAVVSERRRGSQGTGTSTR